MALSGSSLGGFSWAGCLACVRVLLGPFYVVLCLDAFVACTVDSFPVTFSLFSF